MSDFLYTFSSKQISAQLSQPSQVRPCVLVQELVRKRDYGLKNIRTKKLKRYEKLLEHTNTKHPREELYNQFIGLENIASETLVRLSHSPVVHPRSIKTIPENSRQAAVQQTRVSETFGKSRRNERVFQNSHMTPKLGPSRNENRTSGERKRCLSLKQSPLISYPSDQRKLPRVFRCKSIYQSSGKEKEETVNFKEAISKTPLNLKVSHNQLNSQIKQVKSSSRLFGLDDGQLECLNGEECAPPGTPVFPQS